MYYGNKPQIPNVQFSTNPYEGERFFFFPFLTGALLGGAAVGLSRPRPVIAYSTPVAPYQAPMPYGYNYGNFGYYNYR